MWFACLDFYRGEAAQVGEGVQNLQWQRGAEFAVEQAGDQVSALPFTSCVTQSHQLSHTEPSFPHLKPQGQLDLQIVLQNTLRENTHPT